jgi:ferric-dicitrate binding protein FerR (iron transport regulator)
VKWKRCCGDPELQRQSEREDAEARDRMHAEALERVRAYRREVGLPEVHIPSASPARARRRHVRPLRTALLAAAMLGVGA